MLVAGAVGGRAVGEVDGVGGRDGDRFGVEVDGRLVVFARHGGVALAFEELAFRGCDAGSSSAGVFGGGWGCGAAFCRAARAGCAGGGFAFEFLVDAVNREKGLGADGVVHVGFVGGVDVEGVGDAGGGYFDGLGVFGGEGAIFERGGEEVDYGEGETLFGVKGRRLQIWSVVTKGRIFGRHTMMALDS